MLRRAIESVLAQTWQDLRVYVFDDASGDETDDVVDDIRKRDDRVRYWQHPSNLGILPDFQYALDTVETPFFSILSDDDGILPWLYTRAMVKFDAHPEAAFVCQGVITRSSGGAPIHERSLKNIGEGLHRPPGGVLSLLRARPANWAGIVWRREVLRDVHGLDVVAGAPSDMDFILRAAARYPFVVHREAAAMFDAQSLLAGRTFRVSVEAFWPAWRHVMDGLIGAVPVSLRPEAERELVAWACDLLTALGGAAWLRNDLEEMGRASVALRALGVTDRAARLERAARLGRSVPSLSRLARWGWESTHDLRISRRRVTGECLEALTRLGLV